MSKNTRKGDLKELSIAGKIVAVFVMAWLISMSYYAFLFFALAMFPSILALFTDRGNNRFASKTITACNFIGVLPFLFEIAFTYERSLAAKKLMAELTTWLTVYGFAIIGWLLIWVLPQITLFIFNFRAEMKISRLKKQQVKLIDEWGEEVKTNNN